MFPQQRVILVAEQIPHLYLQKPPNHSEQKFNDIHKESSQLITRITTGRMFKIIFEAGNELDVSFPCLSQ